MMITCVTLSTQLLFLKRMLAQTMAPWTIAVLV